MTSGNKSSSYWHRRTNSSEDDDETAATAAHFRTARTSSIDINAGQVLPGSSAHFKTAFERLQRRTKSISANSIAKDNNNNNNTGASSSSSLHSSSFSTSGIPQSKLVWRDRDAGEKGRRGSLKNARTKNIITISVAGLCFLYLVYTGFSSKSSSSSSPLATLRRVAKKSSSLTNSNIKNCANPYSVPGKFHVDYTDPANNYWEPDPSSKCGGITPPRYMQQLRNGNTDNLENLQWMANKTIILFGDSIERDHVSLFCTLLGREAEVIKGNHKLAVTSGINSGKGSSSSGGSAAAAERRSIKDRSRTSRIALKGMQESTLPRVCFIEELNFMIANLYHFGLDEQDYWKNLDQFHPPGSVEERLESHVHAFIQKLRQEGRDTAPDLIEVSSGMYDLARWSKQDISGQRNTLENLSNDRLNWYRSRMNKLMDSIVKGFPNSVKTWRAVTLPEDQAAELDYFNDRFGHSSSDEPPHFPLNRVQQIDAVARELVKPYSVPSHHRQSAWSAPPGQAGSSSSSLGLAFSLAGGGGGNTNKATTRRPPGWVNRLITHDFVYNPWSNLIEGAPAHQLDRLHGGDLATPATLLWADMLLWHLKQGVSP